jgi:putative transposase
MVWTPTTSHRKRVKHYDNGEPHFLTFSCHHRMALLSKDRTRRWLTESLEDARSVHGFHLWAWVFMPEHVHLLLWAPPDRIDPDSESTRGKVSGILADVKRPVGRKAIAYLAKHSPQYLEHLTVRNRGRTYRRFWQAGSGYDENISNVGALHEIILYIHQNPVRRGLVARAEDWLWSSARDWAGLANDELLIRVDRTLPAVLEIPWTRRRSEF